jgi:hypothetical protein
MDASLYMGGGGGSRGFLAPTPPPPAYGLRERTLVGKMGADRLGSDSVEPVGQSNQAWPIWAPPLAGGLVPSGPLELPCLVGPTRIQLFCLCFGPILDHAGSPYFGPCVSLVVLHGFPLFSAFHP